MSRRGQAPYDALATEGSCCTLNGCDEWLISLLGCVVQFSKRSNVFVSRLVVLHPGHPCVVNIFHTNSLSLGKQQHSVQAEKLGCACIIWAFTEFCSNYFGNII